MDNDNGNGINGKLHAAAKPRLRSKAHDSAQPLIQMNRGGKPAAAKQ